MKIRALSALRFAFGAHRRLRRSAVGALASLAFGTAPERWREAPPPRERASSARPE